ncbi:MAG: stage III sporulation protein AF [Hydrogenibacillus sp.]|nr:stage III sporulation protein AF [Hydrogenibacillus sp.]
MTYLSHWLRELIIIVVIATIVDLLLPSGEMRRYGRFVLSLFILVSLVGPLFTLFHVGGLDARSLWEKMAHAGSEPYGVAERLERSEDQTMRLIQANDRAVRETMEVMLGGNIAAALEAALGVQTDVRVRLTGHENDPSTIKIAAAEVYLLGQVHKTNTKADAPPVAETVAPIRVTIGGGTSVSAGSAGASSPTRAASPAGAHTSDLAAAVARFIHEVYGVPLDQVRVIGP